MQDMLTSAMAAAASHPLTTREALSGIWGSISLCAWIFLLVSRSCLETHSSVPRAVHPLAAIASQRDVYSNCSYDR